MPVEAGITITVTSNKFPAILAQFPDQADAATGKTALDCSHRSEPRTPFRHGDLRGRRQVRRVARGHWMVYWPVHYAAYQEFGTVRGVKAQRFARAAAQEVIPGWLAALSHLEVLT